MLLQGLWRLTVLTSLIQLLGLLPIRLLPRGKQEQRQWNKDEAKSAWGGAGFLAFLVAAWLWTIIESVLVMQGKG